MLTMCSRHARRRVAAHAVESGPDTWTMGREHAEKGDVHDETTQAAPASALGGPCGTCQSSCRHAGAELALSARSGCPRRTDSSTRQCYSAHEHWCLNFRACVRICRVVQERLH